MRSVIYASKMVDILLTLAVLKDIDNREMNKESEGLINHFQRNLESRQSGL